MLGTVLLIRGSALVFGTTLPHTQALYDSPMQVPLGIVMVVAAFALIRTHRRFTAMLLIGVIGYGIGGLFVVEARRTWRWRSSSSRP